MERGLLMRIATVNAWCWLVVALVAASPAFAADATAAGTPATAASAPRSLSLAEKPFTGDLDRLLARRMIRVLVPYSRTLYFNDRGRERGITAELVRDFETYLNRRYQTGKRPLTVYLIPTTRDQLLPKLAQGLGDIAAGSLTVTEERMREADFVVQTDRAPVK